MGHGWIGIGTQGLTVWQGGGTVIGLIVGLVVGLLVGLVVGLIVGLIVVTEIEKDELMKAWIA